MKVEGKLREANLAAAFSSSSNHDPFDMLADQKCRMIGARFFTIMAAPLLVNETYSEGVLADGDGRNRLEDKGGRSRALKGKCSMHDSHTLWS